MVVGKILIYYLLNSFPVYLYLIMNLSEHFDDHHHGTNGNITVTQLAGQVLFLVEIFLDILLTVRLMSENLAYT